LTSSRRSCFPAKSKVPPELFGTALEVFDEVKKLIGFHGEFWPAKNGAFYLKSLWLPFFRDVGQFLI